jgi:hypothetical protein
MDDARQGSDDHRLVLHQLQQPFRYTLGPNGVDILHPTSSFLVKRDLIRQ